MQTIERCFGMVICRFREEKNLSQKAFACLAGIDASYEGRIERGEVSVTLGMFQILSASLDIPIERLICLVKRSMQIKPL